MGHKISRKRRRHIRRKQTLKRGGNPFKYFSNFFSSKPTPKYPTSQTDFEPNPNDNYDDDVRRSSMVNEEIVRHGPVTKEDLENLNNEQNEPFGGRRMTRRKRRTKRKSRF
jgi:hypothetical protein